MPRDTAPFLSVLQSSRLLSGWLSSFTLPLWSLCVWGWDCHRHMKLLTLGARPLSTTAGHVGAPSTGRHPTTPVPPTQGPLAMRPCTEPTGREGLSLCSPSLEISWSNLQCTLEGSSFLSQSYPFPGPISRSTPPPAAMLTFKHT